MASNRLAKYNPDLVTITVGGVLIQGYADGEFVVIEDMSPLFNEEIGTDGEVARSPSNDRRKKITIKLLQTSKSNAVLSALLQADLNTPNGATFECSVEDTLGGTICHGAESWIVSYPSSSFDRTAKSREWELHVANGDRAEAGN